MNIRTKISSDEKKYVLSGGSECTVIRHKNNQVYLAHIHMAIHMAYPEVGSVAKNFKRSEYIYVESGSGLCTVNDQSYPLKKGESILVDDGDTYAIFAGEYGLECIVLVTDGENAESIITKLP
ncbi:cupin domain-containing protein [Candidatus Woesebacteria bacterium]|jgi:mannose-6-phosphate isomerase-like protein (cupin superfamily)|nr:cupin domain-containing protein [Candidatus Woesebacteria bacterium]